MRRSTAIGVERSLRGGAARGFALPWALAILVLVAGASAVMVSRVTTMWQSAAVDETDVQAVLSADGAIATARATLRSDSHWAGGRVEIGGVPVAVSVVAEKDERAEWTVTARAGGGVVVEARLKPDGDRVPRVVSWQRAR